MRDRNADVYASRILDILGNDTLRRDMSNASRRSAESRSWKAVASDLQEIYAGVVRR